MHYFATADTDIGNTKSTNQDSLLIKHASYCGGEVMLAVICDGMGGLSKGELASATVIKEFSKWFDEELPYELEKLDMNVIGEKWSLLLKELNIRIIEYGQLNHISLGTTFTGILMVNDKYVIGHVGDTRVYFIGNGMMQLTEDQTFVAIMEVRNNGFLQTQNIDISWDKIFVDPNTFTVKLLWQQKEVMIMIL